MDAPREPRNWVVIFGVVVLALGVFVLVTFLAAQFVGSSDLQGAADKCATDGQPQIGDGGDTLTVDSDGTEATSATVASTCVLAELEAPDSVISKVAGTTAMMGRQTDSWDDYKLTWTYHPDNGLEIIVERD